MPTLDKALVLLAARSDARAALQNALLKAIPAQHDDVTVILWRAFPPGILGNSPQGQAGPGSSLDFVIEASVPAGTGTGLVSALECLRTIAEIDRSRSALVAGTEYLVMPGEGDAALFCPLIRLGHLDAAEFRRYWLEEHSQFGRKDPESRYRQLHPSSDMIAALAAAGDLPAADFDGVAEAYFPDLTAMQARLNSPAVAGEAYADEQRFIDHARSSFLPFERIYP